MDTSEPKTNIIIRNATNVDIPSMITIVPRAFVPGAALPQMIPDTAAVREWWAKTYQGALKETRAHLLVAVDGSKVVGILTMHFAILDLPSSIRQSIISAVPLTPDHSPLLAEALLSLTQDCKELMKDDPHYLIELVGVDEEYKGFGIGRRLSERACEIADERDAAIYLQTSAAMEYYTRKVGLGFKIVNSDKEDGAGGSIVRPRKSKRRDFGSPESMTS